VSPEPERETHRSDGSAPRGRRAAPRVTILDAYAVCPISMADCIVAETARSTGRSLDSADQAIAYVKTAHRPGSQVEVGAHDDRAFLG
jgi:hypothetical protein